MNLIKKLTNFGIIGIFVASTFAVVGCGGVSDAQLAELESLKKQTGSLEQEANSLKEERSKLERDNAEKNAKLQQCAKDKAETKANLEKLPK
jgi:septal ring factor EnvC (AmiA/AmiB activator)